MKKLFSFILAVTAIISLTACNGCNKQEAAAGFGASKDTVVFGAPKMVDYIIATDRQEMFMNYKGEYRWYETNITMKNFLDEETDGTVESVNNIFQVVEQKSETAYDVQVHFFEHTAKGTTKDVVASFWVEDWPMNDEDIKINYEKAFEIVMSVNMPKPHSRKVVLRKAVGPYDANAQWVFGNIRSQIYVDAVTGEVSETEPSFDPKNSGKLAKPLGEWP